jgi:HlyD family secretion protein
MPKSNDRQLFDKTSVAVLVAALAAIGLTGLIVTTAPRDVSDLIAKVTGKTPKSATAASGSAPVQNAGTMTVATWATSAPGRVEPKGGEVAVRVESNGRITEVYAERGDTVHAGDLLARMRDEEVLIRMQQALAEVAVRVAERDEEPPENKEIVPIREAADALAAAERAYHQARMKLDETFIDHRAGKADDAALKAAREAIDTTRATVAEKQAALSELQAKPDAPLPTRLDSGLTLSRADLKLAELALRNTRLHAPVAGTLLRFGAKVGEMASTTARLPIAIVGDMSAIQVTAEVPERDISKVRTGQSVVVRSNAYPGQEFEGRVTEVAPAVGSPGLRSQGPVQHLDAEVLEVTIDMAGKPPLMPGLRVDVFFKAEERVSAATTKTAN